MDPLPADTTKRVIIDHSIEPIIDESASEESASKSKGKTNTEDTKKRATVDKSEGDKDSTKTKKDGPKSRKEKSKSKTKKTRKDPAVQKAEQDLQEFLEQLNKLAEDYENATTPAEKNRINEEKEALLLEVNSRAKTSKKSGKVG